MSRKNSYLKLLPLVAGAALLAGCASMGRPEGGPRDVAPPRYVSSTPGMSQTGVKPKSLQIHFDENVEVKDVLTKVTISPVQLTAPQIVSNGRTVSVDFRDTLKPDETYTIDFGDAIQDLNEGNILDGFSFDFSTGKNIDSLRISGMVLEARTLEPAQGMLVGVHSNLNDTALTKLPFDRVSRTNQLGQFTVKNLKPGKYRVFAVNDINRDYKWDRSEDVAFYDVEVSPTVTSIEVTDTLKDHEGRDSMSTHGGVKYLPNDVFLPWFNEGYLAQYLKNTARPDRNRIVVTINAPTDTLPQVRDIRTGREAKEWSLPDVSAKGDSLNFWITDPQILEADSLQLSVTYQKPDSNDVLQWRTDTLWFNVPSSMTHKAMAEKAEKERKKLEKEREKYKDRDTVIVSPDSVPHFLAFNPTQESGPVLEVYNPLRIESPTPLRPIPPEAVKLEKEVDSLWYPVPGIKLESDSLLPVRAVMLKHAWEPGTKYRLTVDSLAVEDIYGLKSAGVKHEFSVKSLDEYSNITFRISFMQPGVEVDSLPMIVELLDKNDQPVWRQPVSNGFADFRYVAPGEYYARMFIDWDGNGEYTTGDVASHRQPEFTFYYPKALNLKKNWDVEQPWIVDELPLDAQKPAKIKKNKVKTKNSTEDTETDEEEEEELPFGVNPFDDRRNDRKNKNYQPGRTNRNGMNDNGFGSLRNLRR